MKTSPIICIVCNMIIIRVTIASQKVLPNILNTSVNRATTVDRSGERGAIHGGTRTKNLRTHPSDNYKLRSLSVQVTRYVEMDTDNGLVVGLGDEDSKVVGMNGSNDTINNSEAKLLHVV